LFAIFWPIFSAPVSAATILDHLGDGSVRFITPIADGTSNTIELQLGETTHVAICVDHATILPSIADGTSNTIQFSETVGLRINRGPIFHRAPISQITDGTSNTIFFGEIPQHDLCLGSTTQILDPVRITDGTSNTIVFGEDTVFDVCFDNVRVGTTITDGTSNTIQFGETQSGYCLTGVGVAPGLTADIPEPGTLAVAGGSFAALAALRQHRRRQERARI
jgi:hypothetical protein